MIGMASTPSRLGDGRQDFVKEWLRCVKRKARCQLSAFSHQPTLNTLKLIAESR
jgi:hypothetical protein